MASEIARHEYSQGQDIQAFMQHQRVLFIEKAQKLLQYADFDDTATDVHGLACWLVSQYHSLFDDA
jgi:hypothetical protein